MSGPSSPRRKHFLKKSVRFARLPTMDMTLHKTWEAVRRRKRGQAPETLFGSAAQFADLKDNLRSRAPTPALRFQSRVVSWVRPTSAELSAISGFAASTRDQNPVPAMKDPLSMCPNSSCPSKGTVQGATHRQALTRVSVFRLPDSNQPRHLKCGRHSLFPIKGLLEVAIGIVATDRYAASLIALGLQPDPPSLHAGCFARHTPHAKDVC